MNSKSLVEQCQQPWQTSKAMSNPQQNHKGDYTRGIPPRQSQMRHQPSRGRSRPQPMNPLPEEPLSNNSTTPRRKGNPQSPQNLTHHVDSLELTKSRSRSHSSSRMGGGSVDLNSPLGVLSTILTQARSCRDVSVKSYRVNHKLFRDAKERTVKAQQALAQAKAEFEHATTAEEYAHSELNASLAQKQASESHTHSVEKQVRKLTTHLKGKRVKLTGLTQNTKWNGRHGVIVKLVIEGEDCGRWKVRLDKEQRGGDPEGMDGRDSLNGEARGGSPDKRHDSSEDDQDDNMSAAQHVVAKAENLELLEHVDPIGLGVIAASDANARSRSRDMSASSRGDTASSAKSRDPSAHPSDEPRVNTTSDRGRLRSTLSPLPVMSPRKNEKDLPSAFSNMLLSPVSFENVSFTAKTSNSFASSANCSGEQMPNYDTPGNIDGSNRGEHKKSDSSIAGSFFDEVTPQEQVTQQTFPHDERAQYYSEEAMQTYPIEEACHHSVEGESHRGYPQEIYSTDLPTLVILPVKEDEENECVSPHCIGVQGAGVPHINGVYILANDQNGNEEGDGAPSSPLYFKDSPPTLLEDDRYYDMCILRIDCPDSPNHVIWFLSRVDVDPTCLDVKFSDCYYYCRMLRDNGLNSGSPPLSGWNIPKVPPGIAIAPSLSFSLESESYHFNETGERL